jgi:hypothetical protein
VEASKELCFVLFWFGGKQAKHSASFWVESKLSLHLFSLHALQSCVLVRAKTPLRL